MKLMLIKLMMIFSTMILAMKHPMSMGIVLMVQTMLIILMINKMMIYSWFSMVTFMMMIGGLLIMFMYMSSIASNEKFKIKLNLIIMMIVMLMIQEEMILENQIDENQEILNSSNLNFSLVKIYNKKSMLLTLMLILYLLLTMISVTKMVKHYKGPLRMMN